MPLDLITNVSGTNYKRYVQEHIITIGARTALNYADLKAWTPPGNNSVVEACPMALLVLKSTIGTDTLPTGRVYIWVDDETSADNGTTILRPTSYASDATAGRWMALSAVV